MRMYPWVVPIGGRMRFRCGCAAVRTKEFQFRWAGDTYWHTYFVVTSPCPDNAVHSGMHCSAMASRWSIDGSDDEAEYDPLSSALEERFA